MKMQNTWSKLRPSGILDEGLLVRANGKVTRVKSHRAVGRINGRMHFDLVLEDGSSLRHGVGESPEGLEYIRREMKFNSPAEELAWCWRHHDWTYSMSDDHRVWTAGQAAADHIRSLEEQCTPEEQLGALQFVRGAIPETVFDNIEKELLNRLAMPS